MKNIRFNMLLICFVFICYVLEAHDNINLKNTAIKLYYNGLYEYYESNDYDGRYGTGYTFLEKNKRYDFGGISIAIEFQKDKFFSHEYELMPIIIRHSDIIRIVSDSLLIHNTITVGDKTTFIESAFRYQLTHYFMRDKVIMPYLGFSPQLFYNFNKKEPYSLAYFEIIEQNVGLNLAVVPGLTCRLNNKLSIDLNFLFGICEISYNAVYNKNPTLPARNQKESKFIGVLIPEKVNARIGIKYIL